MRNRKAIVCGHCTAAGAHSIALTFPPLLHHEHSGRQLYEHIQRSLISPLGKNAAACEGLWDKTVTVRPPISPHGMRRRLLLAKGTKVAAATLEV